MNSLRNIFNYLSQSDYEKVLSSQSEIDSNYCLDSFREEGKALRESLNSDADVVCPVVSSGWRSSDIDTLLGSTDQRLTNLIASRLHKVEVKSTLPNGLDDSTLAQSALDRNLDLSDMDLINSEIQPVPAAQPVPASPAVSPNISE